MCTFSLGPDVGKEGISVHISYVWVREDALVGYPGKRAVVSTQRSCGTDYRSHPVASCGILNLHLARCLLT